MNDFIDFLYICVIMKTHSNFSPKEDGMTLEISARMMAQILGAAQQLHQESRSASIGDGPFLISLDKQVPGHELVKEFPAEKLFLHIKVQP